MKTNPCPHSAYIFKIPMPTEGRGDRKVGSTVGKKCTFSVSEKYVPKVNGLDDGVIGAADGGRATPC